MYARKQLIRWGLKMKNNQLEKTYSSRSLNVAKNTRNLIKASKLNRWTSFGKPSEGKRWAGPLKQMCTIQMFVDAEE